MKALQLLHQQETTYVNGQLVLWLLTQVCGIIIFLDQWMFLCLGGGHKDYDQDC